jgi:hypothetical protein
LAVTFARGSEICIRPHSESAAVATTVHGLTNRCADIQATSIRPHEHMTFLVAVQFRQASTHRLEHIFV